MKYKCCEFTFVQEIDQLFINAKILIANKTGKSIDFKWLLYFDAQNG